MNLTLMAEENPFDTLHQNDISDIIDQDIEKVQQDPKFHKFIEKILEKDAQKYFMMLANRGLRLPTSFDVNKLIYKGKEKKSHSMEDGTSKNTNGETPKN
jgi:hypothetical protein